MKKLVLGALLLAASTLGTGCIISSGDSDSVVTARWTFTHLENNAPGNCVKITDVALIVAQPWDPLIQANSGQAFVDEFNCEDGQGTIELPDDTYLVWVEMEDRGAITAKSAQEFVDTNEGDTRIEYSFYDDAGYFFFSWDLINEATGRSVSCRDADLDHSNAAVEVVATNVANTQYVRDDQFECADHFGVTDPLLAGNYTVSINAMEDEVLVGEPENFPDRRVEANQLTDLGNIEIQVPVR